MASYPIPDSDYTIDDELQVRNSTGYITTTDERGKAMLTIGGKRVSRRVDELLAVARDGVPIPKRQPGWQEGVSRGPPPEKRRLGSRGDRIMVRTITLRQHWNELREKAGLPPFDA